MIFQNFQYYSTQLGNVYFRSKTHLTYKTVVMKIMLYTGHLVHSCCRYYMELSPRVNRIVILKLAHISSFDSDE